MISVKEAKERLFKAVKELPAENVLIAEASGRVLCQDIFAKIDMPPFSQSAVDGFVIIADDHSKLGTGLIHVVGEIKDEYDSEINEIQQHVRSGEFEVDALISLEDLYEETGIAIPEGPYETAGGYLMHHLGRIPQVHDVINLNGSRITVLTVEGKRAGKLLISAQEWKDKANGS